MSTTKKFVAKNGLDNNSKLITNVLDPVSNQDASTKKYVDDSVAAKASIAGVTMSGNIVMPTSTKITLTDAPAADTDAVNKIYVDANLAGLTWKNSVKLATTANITLSGPQTIDGVSLSALAGYRFLVKNQTTASENGIYIYSSGAWPRATDMDQTTPRNEINSAAVFVEQGVSQANTAWTQINDVTTLGSDPIAFTQFNGAAGVVAGTGLLKTGNQLDVNLGAGVAQLPSDEVGIDVYTGGGLMNTVDGTNPSSLTNAQLSLTKVGTVSTYTSVTTDAYGRITAGTNPTTLAGYGITDAVPNTGIITFTDTTDSSSTTTGALIVAGGVGIAKKLYVGGDAIINTLRVGKGPGNSANNTVMGVNALNANTTGNSNTVFGTNALAGNIGSDHNTAIGSYALRQSTSNWNTAVGSQALYNVTSGSANTAVGYQSAWSTTGGSNTAVGYYALLGNTSGASNVAIGNSSMQATNTGSYHTAVGSASLNNNSSGTSNTAIGYRSLMANTTGSYNIALGYGSAENNITGAYNTALGYQSLDGNISSNENTAIGYKTLFNNSTGKSNIAIGLNAGIDLNPIINASLMQNGVSYRIATAGNTPFTSFGAANNLPGTEFIANGPATGTTGTVGRPSDNNIFIGNNTGAGVFGMTLGSNNTIIGSNITSLNSSLSNAIILADGSGNKRLFINLYGAYGIGGETYGSSGQVLTSAGGSAPPSWTTPSAAGGAAGGAGSAVFYENDQTVTVNYTLTAGKNAMSAGPITVADGIAVTIPTGASWTIV